MSLILHVVMAPGASVTLPPASGRETNPRAVRVRRLESRSATKRCEPSTGAVVDSSLPAPLVAGAHGAEILVLQARPIGEPVAQYGPFVMNTEAEIDRPSPTTAERASVAGRGTGPTRCTARTPAVSRTTPTGEKNGPTSPWQAERQCHSHRTMQRRPA